MNKQKQIIVVFVVVALSLISLEIVSAIVLSKIYNRNFNLGLVQQHKYSETNGLKPNIIATVWGQKFTTDKFSSRPKKKLKQKKKLVFIGDSVLEGIGLSDSLIFTELMENRQFDVLNLSMPGNSSFDYFNIVKAITDSANSEYIDGISEINIIHCLNDIYGKTAAKDLPNLSNSFKSKINLVLSHSNFYRLIKLFLYSNSDYYFQYDAAMYLDKNRVNEVISFYQEIANICKTKNIEFVVYALPYKSQIKKKKLIQLQMFSNEFYQKGIPFYDLTTEFEKKQNDEDLYLFADEIHFSAAGHKAIAEIISKEQ